MTGIYQIRSLINCDRIYVGSAVDIDKRWKEHKRDLRSDRHRSPKLQRHYNKYGCEDYQYTVLKECEKKDLIKYEQYYIDTLNPYFNTLKIANSFLGVKKSQESKDKISRANKGKIGNRKNVKRTEMSIAKGKATVLLNMVNNCIDNGIMYYSKKEKIVIKKQLKDNLKERKFEDKIKLHKKRSIFNKKSSTTRSSLYKGVSLMYRKNKNNIKIVFGAFICKNSKVIWIGTFKTEIEAAIAFNIKSLEIYGVDGYKNDLKR